jgi:hypothetical protein
VIRRCERTLIRLNQTGVFIYLWNWSWILLNVGFGKPQYSSRKC